MKTVISSFALMAVLVTPALAADQTPDILANLEKQSVTETLTDKQLSDIKGERWVYKYISPVKRWNGRRYVTISRGGYQLVWRRY